MLKRGGKVREPGSSRRIARVLGGVGGFARTANESGSVALVMMARRRMPKRIFGRNGDTIWPTAVPSGSAEGRG